MNPPHRSRGFGHRPAGPSSAPNHNHGCALRAQKKSDGLRACGTCLQRTDARQTLTRRTAFRESTALPCPLQQQSQAPHSQRMVQCARPRTQRLPCSPGCLLPRTEHRGALQHGQLDSGARAACRNRAAADGLAGGWCAPPAAPHPLQVQKATAPVTRELHMAELNGGKRSC